MEKTFSRNSFSKNPIVANKLAKKKDKKAKKLLCITPKKSKTGIFCKPKRKEYH